MVSSAATAATAPSGERFGWISGWVHGSFWVCADQPALRLDIRESKQPATSHNAAGGFRATARSTNEFLWLVMLVVGKHGSSQGHAQLARAAEGREEGMRSLLRA